jgi:hypothetical protein
VPPVYLDIEARHDRKKSRTRAACGPEQIRVVRRVGVDEFGVCRHDVDAGDAHAGRAELSATPSETALKQVSSDTHVLAVADGKEEVLLTQLAVELRAFETGLSRRGHRFGIDGNVPEPRHVDQDDPVAQMRTGKAVSARPHRNLAALFPGKPHRAHHVVLVLRRNDHLGKAAGSAGMPNRAPTRLFVVGITAAEHLPFDPKVILGPVICDQSFSPILVFWGDWITGVKRHQGRGCGWKRWRSNYCYQAAMNVLFISRHPAATCRCWSPSMAAAGSRRRAAPSVFRGTRPRSVQRQLSLRQEGPPPLPPQAGVGADPSCPQRGDVPKTVSLVTRTVLI